MASMIDTVPEVSSMSLYKRKNNPILDLSNQNQRRQEVLQRQKQKREAILNQIRFCSIDDEDKNRTPEKSPMHRTKRDRSISSPIGMMLAEWLYSPSDDISSWFIIPCPRGQRCLVVHQSNQTHVYNKNGHLIRRIFTNLPKQSILYCIYDHRTNIYHIIDVIMWNGCDYSIQVECNCRFFILLSLEGDSRLKDSFQILPRMTLDENQSIPPAEDGYLFYHPIGFYESGYSPLVCWLQPFMFEEILSIKLSFPISKPDGYTTAQAFMFEEQTNRKDREKNQDRSQQRKNCRIKDKVTNENQMILDE